MKYAAFTVILIVSLSFYYSANAYRPASHQEVAPTAGSHHNEQSPRLFLIAVFDTNDKDIGERCKTDMDNILYAVNELSKWMFTKLQKKIIQGDDFGKAAVMDAVDNWLPAQQPAADDIIIFYYSGHGFRDSTDASRFPRMWLKAGISNSHEKYVNLQIEADVFDHIKTLGAGMNLVVSDCCNTTNAGDNANFDNIMVPTPKRETHKRDSNPADEEDNGDKLFAPQQPVSVLVTAAAKSEFAAGKPDDGGFFTEYFIDALSRCIYDDEIQPDWKAIFQYTDEQAGHWARSAPCADNAKHNEQGRCIQTVTYAIE